MTLHARRAQAVIPTQAAVPVHLASAEVTDPSGGRGNDAVAAIVAKNNKPTGPRELDPEKTGIVHFGLNKAAPVEASALNRANKNDGGAKSIHNQKGAYNTFKDGKTVYDLSTPEAAAKFTSTLGMSNDQAVATAKLLGGEDLDPYAKDELAHLVKVLSQADAGERDLKRLVLSGHSGGDSLWGDDNGAIDLEQLERLIAIFPGASKGIEHLMMSACSSGGQLAHQRYRKMFPNLQSSVGYRGSSPGTHSGALPQLKSWEEATERGKRPSGVDPEIAGKTRKGKNLTTWNRDDGYQASSVVNTEDELDRFHAFQQGRYPAFFSGRRDIGPRDNHDEVRAHYDRARSLSQDPNVGEADRAYYSHEADRSLRLLHYDDIKGKYAEANKDELVALYDNAGEVLPDFSKLTRKELTEHVVALGDKFPKTEDHEFDFERFTDADHLRYSAYLKSYELYDLDKSAIPNTWI